MITKKLLALSFLFLALPVCAMKRGSRYGRRAALVCRAASRRTSSRVLARGKIFYSTNTDSTDSGSKGQHKNTEKYSKLKKRAKWSAAATAGLTTVSVGSLLKVCLVGAKLKDKLSSKSFGSIQDAFAFVDPDNSSGVSSLLLEGEIFDTLFTISGWTAVGSLALTTQYIARMLLLKRKLKKS